MARPRDRTPLGPGRRRGEAGRGVGVMEGRVAGGQPAAPGPSGFRREEGRRERGCGTPRSGPELARRSPLRAFRSPLSQPGKASLRAPHKHFPTRQASEPVRARLVLGALSGPTPEGHPGTLPGAPRTCP